MCVRTRTPNPDLDSSRGKTRRIHHERAASEEYPDHHSTNPNPDLEFLKVRGPAYASTLSIFGGEIGSDSSIGLPIIIVRTHIFRLGIQCTPREQDIGSMAGGVVYAIRVTDFRMR
jgi:hypothetical protein